MFFWIPAFAADAAVVNPNGMSTLFSCDASTFLANCKAIFNNGPRSWNQSEQTILDLCVFVNFRSVAKLFAKDIQIFETCLSLSNIYVEC